MLHVLFYVFAFVFCFLWWSYYTTDKGSEQPARGWFDVVAADKKFSSSGNDKWQRVVKDDSVACRVYELPLLPPGQRHAPDRKPQQCSDPWSSPWVSVHKDVAAVVSNGAICKFQGD